MSDIPISDIDLYCDDTILNTEKRFSELRSIGPVVKLSVHDMYALTHYESVKAGLRANDILINGKGVAANDLLNNTHSETTIASDGSTHKHRKSFLMRPLTPRSIAELKEQIEDKADKQIKKLLAQNEFCAVRDFASYLPLTVVANLVGLSDDDRDHMLEWAAATFNALGPMNDRAKTSLPYANEVREFALNLTTDQVQEGGWASQVLKAAEDGTLSIGESKAMVLDYLAPALDTTILASAHMFWRLAITPGAYDALKRDETLVDSVVNESVRISSPIRSFTRFAQSDFLYEGRVIPEGSRTLILYASANWDDQHFDRADEFVVDRNPRDHFGWGHGVHLCAGKHLAALEMSAMCRALIRHVSNIEVSKPVPIMNNLLQGFGELSASLH